MTGKVMGSFTKRYSEILLYLLLITNIVLHKAFALPDFSTFVLLFPLLLMESSYRWKNPWNIFAITYPACFSLGIYPYDLLSLTLSAFAEEIFFRAYMMRKYGNFTVSLMFALPHFLIYQNLQSLLTFFPSLFFGFLYKKTNSLIFVSLIHLYSNLVYRNFTFLHLWI